MKTIQFKRNLKSAVSTIREAFTVCEIGYHHETFDLCDYHDRMYHQIEFGRPKKHLLPKSVRFWLDYVRQKFLVVVCDLTDHKWVDTSCGGPDSGDMSGYCTRCGYSFHHQLY